VYQMRFHSGLVFIFYNCRSSFSSVDVNASVYQGPHENVGEKVFKNESGDKLLFVEEMNGVCGGSLCHVVEAQHSGRYEVEEKAQEGRKSQDPCSHTRQHRQRRSAEVQGLCVVHHSGC